MTSMTSMRTSACIHFGTGTPASLPFSGMASSSHLGPEAAAAKPDWLLQLIRQNDGDIMSRSSMKVTEKGNRYFGAYRDANLIVTPNATVEFLTRGCGAIGTPESAYHRSGLLLQELDDAIGGLLALQHSDGTIDLLETNFHSASHTAFMVKRLTPAYTIFRDAAIPGSEGTLRRIEQFLKRAGEALIVGGLHTPNHRWVVCAALTTLHLQWPDSRYVARAEEWLAEKIDLDPDGQYTEKSTAGYSAEIDRVLITVANGLGKPELLDAVRKNLRMMRYYLHPNGEVVTEASNRQDKGTIGTMEGYYFALRYMAILDNDGEFASICRIIEGGAFNRLASYLELFLTTPLTWGPLPALKPLPVSYIRAFPYSGVVRIRRNDWDCTILSNNAGWLTFHKKHVMLQAMRLAGSFFGKGQFLSSEIRQEGSHWVLTQEIEGVYYQPYPKDRIPGDGDWAKMPRLNRKMSEIQRYKTVVRISETPTGIRVDIDVSGTEHVPVALELIFRKGGQFTGVEAHPGKPDAYLMSGAKAEYAMGGERISFGPGRADHRNVSLRGALPSMDAPSVFITGQTPFRHSIEIG